MNRTELLPSRATSSSEDFGPFCLADFISPAVAQFLGVRSLVCFGATSKSNRSAVTMEVGRRKMRIAEAEVEVARLMTSQEQTAKLSAFIDRVIDLDDDHDDDGLDEMREMYSHLEEESGEVVVRNPTREHFSAAKKIIHDAMRLIDDEIGIFHTAEVSDYIDVWEDFRIISYHFPDIAFPFVIDEPGDKIDMFREERRKFFAIVKASPLNDTSWAVVGSLFLLPSCFYFPLLGGSSRMSGNVIAEASVLAASIMGEYYRMLIEDDDAERFIRTTEKMAMQMLAEDYVDAFRVVAREFFFKATYMRDVLWKMITTADEKAVECSGCSKAVLDYLEKVLN